MTRCADGKSAERSIRSVALIAVRATGEKENDHERLTIFWLVS